MKLHSSDRQHTLDEFPTGDRVFIAYLESPWQLIGVQVLTPRNSAGTVDARVIYTDDIPGFKLGETLCLDGDQIAWPSVTPNLLIEHRADSREQTVPGFLEVLSYVLQRLGDKPEDFHVTAIMRGLISRYDLDRLPQWMPLDEIPDDEFWELARMHEVDREHGDE